MLCQCTQQFNFGSCQTRSPPSIFCFCSSISRYFSPEVAHLQFLSMTNLQWSCFERQILWAPLYELCKSHLLTNIHPVDMQRGDAFWGVAVQDHRIPMLHIQRLDFFFGEFWYTCTKKQRCFFYYWYLLKICLLLSPWYSFNKIFTFISSFAFSTFSTDFILHRGTE